MLPQVEVTPVPAVDPGSCLAPGWHHGAFMEIFVRSYADSNGDGIGDLRGLISKLDYLQDLGIKGIWLMPMHKSQDHDHGYAVLDFRSVETPYGDMADFDELLKQAHARGIGVIIDYVINHSAFENPLFLNSRDSASNPYRDWYVWQSPAPAGWNIQGADPWRNTANGAYFAGFSDYMPDFNFFNPAVLEYHKDNLRFWLNRGVDGFRFDAVGNLVENGPDAWESQPQNYVLMHDLRSTVMGYSERYMVCEAPGDPQGFGAPSAGGAAFAFDLNYHIINAARGDTASMAKVSGYYTSAPSGMATMVSNHDGFAGDRLWDQLGGNLAQYRLAAAAYLLLPGTPFIYYGEEIGASSAALDGDAKLRAPMSWTPDTATAGFTSASPYRALATNVATHNVATQAGDPNSLHGFYKTLLALRNARPSISEGSYDAPFVHGQVMGYRRRLGNETTLVLINFGEAAATVAVDHLAANGLLANLHPNGGVDERVDATGHARITIDAQTLRVFDVKP
jgi:glycosidase